MILEICMQIRSVVLYLHLVDKLTSKKYAITINLLCPGNKIFVKYQAQERVLTPITTPCVRPCEYATSFGHHRKYCSFPSQL